MPVVKPNYGALYAAPDHMPELQFTAGPQGEKSRNPESHLLADP
jgi:hypothetical protein